MDLRKKRPEETDPGLPAWKDEPPAAPTRPRKAKAGRGGCAGIRCPLCGYRPKKSDRWYCRCGHSWNTFDTHGKCPGCGFQWTKTACLACHQWSDHEAWYEAGPPPS